MRLVTHILIFLFSGILPTDAAIRFLLPELQHYTHGNSPISGNIDVLISLLPEDLPREVSSVNIAFATNSSAVEFGLPTNPSERSLFDVTPVDFSPNPQTIFVGIDLIDTARDSTPLFDEAILVRVPYQIEAGTTGDFDLAFNVQFNELADNDFLPLPLDATDTGLISIQEAHRADYNLDGLIDILDYTTWSESYGISGCNDADGNRDNVVNAADYTIWRNTYTQSATANSSVIAVPEPVAMSLLLLSFSFLSVTRRDCNQTSSNNKRMAKGKTITS